jgi:hypothetical protein
VRDKGTGDTVLPTGDTERRVKCHTALRVCSCPVLHTRSTHPLSQHHLLEAKCPASMGLTKRQNEQAGKKIEQPRGGW